MANSRTKPVDMPTLTRDRRTIKALRDLTDYRPHRPEHTPEALLALDQEVLAVQDAVDRARREYEAARARLIALSWVLHDSVLGARTEVVVLFGPDSNAVHAVGLKRKSERKRPVRPARG